MEEKLKSFGPGLNSGPLEPLRNRRARQMLDAILRRNLRAQVPEYEPSRWVIAAVLGSISLIIATMLVAIFIATSPASRVWVFSAIAFGCLAPYGIGFCIVQSVRKQNRLEKTKRR